jgi:hypothetical protein
MADNKSRGKTRAGTEAQAFPWEEALEAQLGRTTKRLKGLATDPVQEGVNIVRQYLHDSTASPEENERKVEDFIMGFAGTTKLPSPKLLKASEVFGPHEGKTAMFTESDRTKVGGGFLGGSGFSGLQHELPAYKGKAWGVASMPKAQTIIGSNQRVPEGQAIWAPYIGHPEQHRSNQMVFDQIFNQFRREAKKGNLPNDLREKINERLAAALDSAGNPLYPPDVDIMAKNFRQLSNTFERRAAAAEIMGGKGVGGKKGSIIDYPGIIESTTDPALVSSPTWSVGHRAFTLTGDVGVHPELHPAFPYLLYGEDLGKTFTPVPHELAMRDFIEKVKREKGRKVGYMDLARGYAPEQFISEDWLTSLQKAGYAKGGLAMATGGQAFPLQEEFQLEVERRAARPRTRAGVPVEDTNVLGGALRGLANTLGGMAFGRTVGTLGMPADILEPTAAPGAMIPMFGMAGMPSEISKALVQRFAPKGPDIPAPTSEYLLEKGLEKFKPPQEFEQAAKLSRFMPFDVTEMQAAGRKLKALQPTFMEMMESGLQKTTAPARMYAAPEDGAKLSKEEYSRMMREKYAAQNLAREEKKVTAADLKPQEVKVPADELGFYSPAEKAAANLKRNIGTGEAFLSDLRKAPDVGETDLIHTGLENWLKGKKTVSKQEIQDYMTKNRLKLQKEELRAGEGNVEDLRFRGGDAVHDSDYINMVADDYINDWDSLGYRSKEEIRDEILRQYTPEEAEQLINSGQLDEMIDDEIRDLAYRLSEDQYYDNPYREWSNDTGYTIFGNDDVGYSIRSPIGDDITPNRGAYDFETAEGTVQQHAMDNGYVSEGGTQYHDYQLEGPSTNYREHLTRLSRGKARSDLQEELADVRRAMDDPLDQEEYNQLAKIRDELEDELSQHHKPYESSHWPGDDVVSHSRTQDRVDVEGKDTLHIDEIQSDWHQDAAEFGYADKATRQQYKDLMRERAGLAADFSSMRDDIANISRDFSGKPGQEEAYRSLNEKAQAVAQQIDEINMRLSDIERAVPDAPFKRDWVEKELKKLLRVAAEEGKERITLSRWQDQLKRWGTDSVGFKKTSDGVWSVTATKNRRLLPGDMDDTVTADEIYYKTSIRGGESPVTSKSELRKIIKTDLSKGWSNAHIDRVTNKVWDQMNKLQIDEVGAIDPRKEGFKATYGKSFIETMQKLAKKYGAKTGTTQHDIGYNEFVDYPYIDVTGKAASSAKKGFPYKEGGAVRKADGGAVHPAVEKFAASLPHPAVTEFENRVINLGDMITGGGAIDLSNKVVGSYAMGGAAYNTIPDVSDAEKMVQGPAF